MSAKLLALLDYHTTRTSLRVKDSGGDFSRENTTALTHNDARCTAPEGHHILLAKNAAGLISDPTALIFVNVFDHIFHTTLNEATIR